MTCSWEHINGCCFLCGIAEVGKEGAVTREGCGVAGNIDNSVGVHLCRGFNHVGAAALSRRVKNNNIGAYALIFKGLCRLRRIAADKARIFYTVQFRVDFCVNDCFGHNFNADNFFCVFCH